MSMEQLQSFENRIQTLADQALLEQTQQLFKREKRIGDAILLGLKEIKVRRVYSALGYSSLFEMLVDYFKLSESSSYQRLNALKLIEAVPEAQEFIFRGEVSVTNAALVQSVIQRSEKETQAPFTLEEKKELIEVVKGKTHKEAQALLIARHPMAALPANREKPLTPKHTQLQLTVDQESMELLQEARDLLSHSIPNGDLSKVLKRIAVIAVEQLRKKKGRTSPEAPVSTGPLSEKTRTPDAAKHCVADTADATEDVMEIETTEKEATEKGRYIPQETKRIVFARAGGQCEFVGSEGHRCTSTFQLEIDHIQCWSQGGGNEPSNLSVKCRSHNFYRTKETHGFLFNPKISSGKS